MLKDKFRRYTSSSKDPPPLNLSSTIKCLVNSVNKKQQQNAIGFGITSQFSISSLSSWLFIDTKCVLLDFICNWSDFRQIYLFATLLICRVTDILDVGKVYSALALEMKQSSSLCMDTNMKKQLRHCKVTCFCKSHLKFMKWKCLSLKKKHFFQDIRKSFVNPFSILHMRVWNCLLSKQKQKLSPCFCVAYFFLTIVSLC